MSETHTSSPDESADPSTLVEQLIEADDERRRLRHAGEQDELTIELSAQLSPAEREELLRMLECADRLEALAATDVIRQSPPTRVYGDNTTDRDTKLTETFDYHIGAYRIVRLIADGGFGSVLLAVDEVHDERLVALKIPRPDIRFTERLRERFLIEARAASTLNHPNIVKVHATIADPVTAIVYEYCEGGTLTQHVDPDRPLEEKTAVEITLRLAEALHHAHTRGILHRDVKPGNVMLVPTQVDDPHDDHAVTFDGERWIPKLGDFGLAKVIDDSANQTLSGVVMGTPQFMAPEQAAGRVSELGTHTDIFSLGSIFYWLLTGKPPFDAKATLQTLRMIEEEDPTPPRRTMPELSARAEAVCLKCLRKPIDARYESAAALVDDLKRLLTGEPVAARPLSLAERVGVWIERNPAWAAISMMLPLAAMAALLLQWQHNRSLQNYIGKLDAANQRLVDSTQEAQDYGEFAERQQERYQRMYYSSAVQLAQRAFDSGDVRTYADTLAEQIPGPDDVNDLRGPEWQALWDMGHLPETVVDRFPSAVYMARLSADGKFLAACGEDATVRVYDTSNWQRIALIETGQGEVNYAAFSSDGTRIASAGDDGTIMVWDWRSGEVQLRIEAYDNLVYCVQFYDGDTKLASGGRNPVVQLWDVASGELVQELKPTGQPTRVEQLDVSPTGRVIASASNDGVRRVWTLDDFQPVERLPAVESQPVSSVCLFRRDDEDWMLSGTLRQQSRQHCSLILEVIGREEQRVLPIHFDGVQSVAVDPSGKMAVAGDLGRRISMIDINAAINGPRWWHPQTVRRHWYGHDGVVYGLAVTADGQRVISAGSDGKLSVWSPNATAQGVRPLAERSTPHPWIHAVVANENTILVTDSDMQLHRWDDGAETMQPVIDHATEQPLRLAVNENQTSGCIAIDGNRLYGRLVDGPVGCWQLENHRAKQLWTVPTGEDNPGTRNLTVSKDGRLLAVGRQGNPTTIVVMETSTGKRVAEFVDPQAIANGTRALTFDARASKIAYGTGNNIFIGDLASGTQHVLGSHEREVRSLYFVPDSPLLLSGGDDRVIRIWNVETGKLKKDLIGHRGSIECLATHPFGDRIVSTGEFGWVRIWNLQDGMLLAELPPVSDKSGYAAVGSRLFGIADEKTLFRQDFSCPSDRQGVTLP